MHLQSTSSASVSPSSPSPTIARQRKLAADITGLLRRWNDRDPRALEQLVPEVLDDLRHLARGYLAREDPDHTLQPTALVNEVYLRLRRGRAGRFEDRGQFFAFAARLMREILVDHARARRTAKRGGGCHRVDLEQALGVAVRSDLDPASLLTLCQHLDRLGDLDPEQQKIVEMRYFVGLTLPEIAAMLRVSLSSVERRWRVARRWLAREMAPGA